MIFSVLLLKFVGPEQYSDEGQLLFTTKAAFLSALPVSHSSSVLLVWPAGASLCLALCKHQALLPLILLLAVLSKARGRFRHRRVPLTGPQGSLSVQLSPAGWFVL